MATGDINNVIDLLSKTSVGDEKSSHLTFAGRGLKLDNENDAKEIVDALNSSKNLKVLELKGNTLGVNAAKAISEALKTHSDFERALWSDLFTGRLKTEIPDALKYLCSGIMAANARLVELDLSDNAFGPNGMIGLVDFLKSSSCYMLRELRLNNNGLGIQGGKMLAESLLGCYASSVDSGTPLQLRVFVSGRGRLENEGATALAAAFKAMRSLEEVHMPQNGINHEGITALADAFRVNQNLRHINLSDNTFTEKGSKSMAQTVSDLQRLEVINFEDCLMRTDGVKALAKAINDKHRDLKIVKLSGNEITKQGAVAITDALKNRDKLETLELNANQLGDKGIKVICGIMKAVGKLDLLGSFSDDEGSEDENEEDETEEPEDVEEKEEEKENKEMSNQKDQCKNITPRATSISGRTISSPQVMSQRLRAVSHKTTTTPAEFLLFPSSAKLQEINTEEMLNKILDSLGCAKEEPEKWIDAFMKVSLVVTPSDEKTKQAAFTVADALMSKLFASSDNERRGQICNILLVQLGLIKSEDKKFRPPSNVEGPLTVLEHVCRQAYFPKEVKDILGLFLKKSDDLLEKCSEPARLLLRALSS